MRQVGGSILKFNSVSPTANAEGENCKLLKTIISIKRGGRLCNILRSCHKSFNTTSTTTATYLPTYNMYRHFQLMLIPPPLMLMLMLFMHLEWKKLCKVVLPFSQCDQMDKLRFNILPFSTMTICPIASKISQS